MSWGTVPWGQYPWPGIREREIKIKYTVGLGTKELRVKYVITTTAGIRDLELKYSIYNAIENVLQLDYEIQRLQPIDIFKDYTSVDYLLDLLSTAFNKEEGSFNHKLMQIFSKTLHDLADLSEEVRLSHYVDTAFGRSLDYIGAGLGVYRLPNESDEHYRARIRVSLFAMATSATIPAIRKTLATLLQLDEENIIVQDYIPEPATMEVWLPRNSIERVFLTPDLVKDFIYDVKPAGVKLRGIFMLGTFEYIKIYYGSFSYMSRDNVKDPVKAYPQEATIGGRYSGYVMQEGTFTYRDGENDPFKGYNQGVYADRVISIQTFTYRENEEDNNPELGYASIVVTAEGGDYSGYWIEKMNEVDHAYDDFEIVNGKPNPKVRLNPKAGVYADRYWTPELEVEGVRLLD